MVNYCRNLRKKQKKIYLHIKDQMRPQEQQKSDKLVDFDETKER